MRAPRTAGDGVIFDRPPGTSYRVAALMSHKHTHWQSDLRYQLSIAGAYVSPARCT